MTNVLSSPSRRALLAVAGGLGLASSLGSTSARAAQCNQQASGKTFVFAHGSWHGGWCWQRVADRLRAQGHRAFTPSYTGMGDREHLLSKDITIETFVRDVAEVLLTEELSDVILVGHSFGGVPISGVADRMPEKILHLVYLDAVVLESGQTAFSNYPPKDVEERIEASNKANGGLAVPNPMPLPPSWGFTEGTADYAWVMRRITPTPLQAYMTALDLHAPVGNGLPRTYIHCYQPENPVIEPSRALVRSLSGWNWIDFPGPHDSMITRSDEIVKLLLQV
ncbi:alpha/beta fold hydrolase [Methylocella sp.]|jgi:pimeloyl-ACP methyl ester carboxylesterase|uniref:alpha/beta fold hydrolase n=1 Tax=Methylocella sp. TaxID=1978226 RepID=UPI003C1DAA75